jgi:hypothetical protein
VVYSKHYLVSAEEHDGNVQATGGKSGDVPSPINTLSSPVKVQLQQTSQSAHCERRAIKVTQAKRGGVCVNVTMRRALENTVAMEKQ